MTKTTIAAGKISLASQKTERSNPRRVFVSVAESLTDTDQPEVNAALGHLIRVSDVLVAGASPDRAIAFAERHGLMIEYDRTQEVDLVVAVMDPLMPHGTGNTLPQNALASARRHGIDNIAVLARAARPRV